MSKKILILDDSATAKVLFKMCFEEYPEYEVIPASHWQEALEKANVHQPFMVVLDYNMPEKSGTEVAKLLQDAGVKAHYVLLTANTQQFVLDEIKTLGFLDVLEKPISTKAIQLLLEKI